MRNRWYESKASECIVRYKELWGEERALRTYTSRLLGAEKELVLHGGGNTSVKTTYTNILGESVSAIFVKASGYDMAVIEPDGLTGLDLKYLKKLKSLSTLSDEMMINEFRTHQFDYRSATPSLETLAHALISKKYVDHTHPDAILTLTNQSHSEELIKEALGQDVIILEYITPGFRLAKAIAEAYEAHQTGKAMVLIHHGLFTWGDTARESYERTIEMVTRAEEYIAGKTTNPVKEVSSTDLSTAMGRYISIAPMLRGLLAERTQDADRPYLNVILRPLIDRETLDFIDSERGKELGLTPPLTTDYLIRTKAFPLWIDEPDYSDREKLQKQISEALVRYSDEYDAYIRHNTEDMETGLIRFDPLPRVILMPGLGAVCVGKDVSGADIARDITAHTLAVKASIAAMGGTYKSIEEHHLFAMEYRKYQHAKLDEPTGAYLKRKVALVTGAAGAIGSGICKELLKQGCHVAVTDLPGQALEGFYNELCLEYGERVLAVPLDVTNPVSVTRGFHEIIKAWGGIDLVVVNAGVAHVALLADMDIEAFRRLEKINVEGALLILAESGRHFTRQGTGGDIVLISTKNVFAPGASFGAYSATKAASHQLARIASLELAEIGVRVNMVSPDAVFSEGIRKSGLWKEVGPGRMRARGLDEKGLEEYYQNRNLLKAKVTAGHVASAVIFFAMRQTPTTGATLPVDGGLPDSVPR